MLNVCLNVHNIANCQVVVVFIMQETSNHQPYTKSIGFYKACDYIIKLNQYYIKNLIIKQMH